MSTPLQPTNTTNTNTNGASAWPSLGSEASTLAASASWPVQASGGSASEASRERHRQLLSGPTGLAGNNRRVVLDTAPFIRGVRFEKFGDEFWTIPEVLAEIRDSKARAFLEQIAVPIKTREPTPEAVKAGTTAPSAFSSLLSSHLVSFLSVYF